MSALLISLPSWGAMAFPANIVLTPLIAQHSLDIAAQVLIVLGAVLFSTAGIGLIRLRDAYSRSSAVATAAGLGVSLIVAGAFLMQPSWQNLAKVAVAIMLQLATSAIGSMAITRAAYLTKSPMSNPTHTDDLADAETPEPESGGSPEDPADTSSS